MQQISASFVQRLEALRCLIEEQVKQPVREIIGGVLVLRKGSDSEPTISAGPMKAGGKFRPRIEDLEFFSTLDEEGLALCESRLPEKALAAIVTVKTEISVLTVYLIKAPSISIHEVEKALRIWKEG